MICEKCGAQLKADDKFCIECGNIVNQLPPIKNDELTVAKLFFSASIILKYNLK